MKDHDDQSIVYVLDLAIPRGTVVRSAPPPPSQSKKTSRGRKSTTTETATLRRSFSEVLTGSCGANYVVDTKDRRRRIRRSSTASTASLDTIAQDKSPVVTIAATGSPEPRNERRTVARPRAAESSDEPKAQDEERAQDEPKALDYRNIIITTPLPPARLAGNGTPSSPPPPPTAYGKTSAMADFITASSSSATFYCPPSSATFYCPSQPDADDLGATSRGDDDDDRRPGGMAGGRAFPRPRKCSLWTRSKELVTGCFACAGRRMCYCEGF